MSLKVFTVFESTEIVKTILGLGQLTVMDIKDYGKS